MRSDPPTSRRAQRVDWQDQHERYRRRRVIMIVAISVIVLITAFVAWIGFRGLAAKGALEEAQDLISSIQEKASANDFDGAVEDTKKLQERTETAEALTSDPIWRVAEVIPGLGTNFTVVRELAEVVNTISVDAVGPLVGFASTGIDALKPVDGRIDLENLAEVGGVVRAADETLAAASDRVATIDASSTVGALVAATDKVRTLLDKVVPLAHTAREVVDMLPTMLGGDGPRSYILLFQNNAESLSLGGATSSWAVLNFEDGKMSIGAQPGTADFDRTQPVPIELPAELLELYNPDYFRYSNTVTLRPDFPTAGRLAQAFYARAAHQTVDGVIALDPVALGFLLQATGPLTLPSGQVLDSNNAASMLLSGVYSAIADPYEQDKFFASAAVAVFQALTGGSADVTKLAPNILRAVTEHRLMAWASDPDEQAVVAKTPLAGTLQTDNVDETQVGVFFVENSASKMSYYLKTTASLHSETCEPDPNFRVSMTLNSDITPEAYAALPWYVQSQVYTDPPMTRTLVFLYGPPGGTYTGWEYGGGGYSATEVEIGTDLGRPVVQIAVDLLPGQTANLTATFSAPTGSYGPLDLRVTPMYNPTTIGLDNGDCG